MTTRSTRRQTPARAAATPNMADVAGPTKINPTVAEQLLACIRRGMTWEGACEVVDAPTRTVRRWRERGQEELHRIEEGFAPRPAEAQFADLAAGVIRARRQCEQDALERIQQIAAGGDTKKRTTVTTRRLLKDDQLGGEAGDEVIATTTVEEVFRPEWTAAAWILERIIGGHYRRRDRLELSVDPAQVSGQLIGAVRKVFADPELALSDGQRQVAQRLLATELRALVAAGDEVG